MEHQVKATLAQVTLEYIFRPCDISTLGPTQALIPEYISFVEILWTLVQKNALKNLLLLLLFLEHNPFIF